MKLIVHGLSPAPAQSAPSKRENTLIEISFAPGATPLNVAPLPAAIPATCVPWRQPLSA